MKFKKFNVFLNSKISPYKKTIKVDSDKSLSIRGFLIGSISQGISVVKNVLESEDVKTTITACRNLGVRVKKIKPGKYNIYGKGLGSFYAKKNASINFGNSGTLARLLLGILSTTPNICIRVLGDHSLNKRNMKKLINLMQKFGATFLPKNKYLFPLKLISSNMPIGIEYEAGVSAQLKSAVLLAGLNSYGKTIVIQKRKSRDHTENMLLSNSQTIHVSKKIDKRITVLGKKYLNKIKINVPNDPSSAAFFSALTLLNRNSSILIKNVGLNPTRIGFYKILKKNGAKITFKNIKKKNNEINGDIFVKSSKLKPIIASKHYYTNMTDEYPILFIMAALIRGVSSFKGISDLTNKESNRITEMQKILRQIDIKSVFKKDELKIYGKGMINASNKAINVSNLGDHRVCMSSFVLALLTGAKTKINHFETVFTSSPSFLKLMKSLGAKFEVTK